MPRNVTIIIPTYNEKDNIKTLIQELFKTAGENDINLEVIFVDDNSPDGTAEEIGENTGKHNIRLIRRSGKMGLATAVIEGFNAASNEVVGVMDADLSHDPTSFPEVSGPVLNGESWLSIGSRYADGGGIEKWGLRRKIISGTAKALSRPLTSIADPMSGFFFTKKTLLEKGKLDPVGYKILLEIIVKCRPDNIREVPITFRDRMRGDSKLDLREQVNYLIHLLRLYSFKIGLT
ncbi:MAG: polyprenol monophosphomannose synthase [Candidatus Altiarchaeota archaeon]